MPNKRKEGSIGVLKVKCIITDTPTTLNSTVYAKRLEQYGTPEGVKSHYICRGAAKLLRQGLTPDQVRRELGISSKKNWKVLDPQFIAEILGEKMADVIKQTERIELTDEECFWRRPEYRVDPNWGSTPIDVAEATKETCLNPPLYLDKLCYMCSYYDQCTLPIKHLRKEKK